MAEHEKDQLADLLSGMINGEHPQEEEHVHDEDGHAHEPPAPTPAPAPVAPQRAATPKPQAPARPAAPVRPAAPPRPAAPVRPVAPVPVVAQPPRPAEPQAEEAIEDLDLDAAPPAQAAAEELSTEDAEQQAIDEDDQVIAPPPPPSAFAPKKRIVMAAKPHLVQTLNFKRTIIPVLLTLGTVCLVLAILGFVADIDSPFSVFRRARVLGLWVSLWLILIALPSAALGVITMFQVKSEMDKIARHKEQAEAQAAH